MNKSNTNKSLTSIFSSKTGKYLTFAEARQIQRKFRYLDKAGLKEYLKQYEDEHPIDEESYEFTGAIEGLNS